MWRSGGSWALLGAGTLTAIGQGAGKATLGGWAITAGWNVRWLPGRVQQA